MAAVKYEWERRMNREIRLHNFRNICIGIAIIFLVIFLAYKTSTINHDSSEHIIMSISKIENVSGNEDGFSTEVYYLVTTDKGAYRIETTGWNAHPECASIREGQTYILTTQGINAPFFGMYPAIISYQKSGNN